MSEEKVPDVKPDSQKKLWIGLGIAAGLVAVALIIIALLLPSAAQKAIDKAKAAGMPVDAAAMKLRYPAASAQKLLQTRDLAAEQQTKKFPASAAKLGKGYTPVQFNEWFKAQRANEEFLYKLDAAVADGLPAHNWLFEPVASDPAALKSAVEWSNLYWNRLALHSEWGKRYEVLDYWNQMNRLFVNTAKAPYLAGTQSALTIFGKQIVTLTDLAENDRLGLFNSIQLANIAQALSEDEILLQNRLANAIADEIYLQVAWVANPEMVVAETPNWKPAKAADAAKTIEALTQAQPVAGKDFVEAQSAFSAPEAAPYRQILQEVNSLIAKSRGMRVAIAVIRYQQKNGKLPEKLPDLVPAFMKQLPTNPLNGKPYDFQPGSIGAEALKGFKITSDQVQIPVVLQ